MEGCEVALFIIYCYARRGYCEVGGRRVSVEGEVGRKIEVEECEAGVSERIFDDGTLATARVSFVREYHAVNNAVPC